MLITVVSMCDSHEQLPLWRDNLICNPSLLYTSTLEWYQSLEEDIITNHIIVIKQWLLYIRQALFYVYWQNWHNWQKEYTSSRQWLDNGWTMVLLIRRPSNRNHTEHSNSLKLESNSLLQMTLYCLLCLSYTFTSISKAGCQDPITP